MAGKSTIPPLLGGATKAVGSVIPIDFNIPTKVPDHPDATALQATKYSAVRHHPIIIATISPNTMYE